MVSLFLSNYYNYYQNLSQIFLKVFVILILAIVYLGFSLIHNYNMIVHIHSMMKFAVSFHLEDL